MRNEKDIPVGEVHLLPAAVFHIPVLQQERFLQSECWSPATRSSVLRKTSIDAAVEEFLDKPASGSVRKMGKKGKVTAGDMVMSKLSKSLCHF